MMRGIGRIKLSAAAVAMAAILAVMGTALPAMAAEAGGEAQEVTTEAAAEGESGSGAQTAWPEDPSITSTAGCLMDAKTGAVLYGKAMDEKRYPASITKVLTVLLALENCNLDDEVIMDETGVAYAVSGSSNLYTVVGEEFTVRELIYGTMLKSANDMATQLGKHIGNGSMDTFLQMMNDRAAELGCTGTHFNNACGMPDENHYTTAHDMARIMQAAVCNHDFCAVVSKPSYTISASNIYAAREVTSHNLLLVHPEFHYPGIIGGKTGYTDAAGQTLVNGALRDGVTMVVCTMQAPDVASAAYDNIKLLDFGYDKFEEVRAIPEDKVVSGGILTVPKGVTPDDCEVATELVVVDSQACERWDYTYADHFVGSAVVTKETAAVLRGEVPEETETGAAPAAEENENSAEETGTGMVARSGALPTIMPDREMQASVNREEMDARFEKIGKTIIGISLGFIVIFGLFLIGSIGRAIENRD